MCMRRCAEMLRGDLIRGFGPRQIVAVSNRACRGAVPVDAIGSSTEHRDAFSGDALDTRSNKANFLPPARLPSPAN